MTPSQQDRHVSNDGAQVRRPAGWWTSAEHELLNYLESVGFAYSPRVIGVESDEEILRFIPGESGKDSWVKIVSEEGLRSFARLLRTYHEAARGFMPPAETEWAFGRRALREGELVCHGDFGPWNIVWEGDSPVGLLDWDLAYPGPPIEDVAYALEYSAPFRDDEACVTWLGYEHVPDRRLRIEIFADEYGLDSTDGLVDEVVRRQGLTATRSHALTDRGFPRSAEWPSLEELEARAVWTERNRRLFDD